MEYIFVEELPETGTKQDIKSKSMILTQNKITNMNDRNVGTKVSKTVQICKTPVKILPKLPIVSPKTNPTRASFKTRKSSSPRKIFSTPPKSFLYDENGGAMYVRKSSQPRK